MKSYDPYGNAMDYDWQQEQSSPYLGAASQQSMGGAEGASAATAGATGAMAAGPAGAAIGVGGSLLVNYMQQKAREAEQRKQAEVQAHLKSGEDQKDIMGSLMNNWRSAMSGR